MGAECLRAALLSPRRTARTEPDQRSDGRGPQPAQQLVDGAPPAIRVLVAHSRRGISTPGSVRSSRSPPSSSPAHGAAIEGRPIRRAAISVAVSLLVIGASCSMRRPPANGDVRRRGDGSLGHLRGPEDLDLMPAHWRRHPFPFPGRRGVARRVREAPELTT